MSARIAYIDCFSGVSGDMFLGALVDLGLPLNKLDEELAKLDISGYRIEAEKHSASTLAATRLKVNSQELTAHRHFSAIKNLISTSALTDGVKEKVLDIFTVLAEAEAAVHGCGIEEVHFHEVGAIDAIVDIVGSAVGVEQLGITKIICAPLPMPRGWVDCDHGRLPVPAPAVLEILKDVPVHGVEIDQEMVTPTGAAIIKALAADFGPMPAMRLEKTGYGAGSRSFGDDRPNLLRIILGSAAEMAEAQEIEIIETNLDDMQPEIFPYLYEKLFELQALDVAIIPIQMKKGRPGFQLQVICRPAHSAAVKSCLLTETTALGLRFRREQRLTLPRSLGTINTQWGAVRVKRVETPQGPILTPEYEDCRRLALEIDIPLSAIYRAVSGSSIKAFIAEEPR